MFADQWAGGQGGRARVRALRLGAGGGRSIARETAGNESRVTPLCSSSAKIDHPPGNNAAPAKAHNASVTSVR